MSFSISKLPAAVPVVQRSSVGACPRGDSRHLVPSSRARHAVRVGEAFVSDGDGALPEGGGMLVEFDAKTSEVPSPQNFTKCRTERSGGQYRN